MKNRKPIVMCVAALCVGGYALAQDAGFQVPLNSGLNVPIPTGDPADSGFYSGSFGESVARRTHSQGAPKSRADGMTAEQIAAALEAVRVQKEALEQWERELRTAAMTKRMSSLGALACPPAPPADPRQIFTFGCVGLFGGQ